MLNNMVNVLTFNELLCYIKIIYIEIQKLMEKNTKNTQFPVAPYH